MLNKEAIEKLQHDATAARVIEQTKGYATALQDDYEVVSLEQYADAPMRFHGSFVTGSIVDFIRYANDNKQADSALFINADNNRACLIIDHGTHTLPKHGAHKATLDLQSTAAWRAVRSLSGDRLSQQKMAEWIEEWADNISIEDEDGENMTIAQATAAIRRIEIKGKSEREFEDNESSRRVSAMEQIEAKMRGKQPKTIRFTCVPFDGFEPTQAEVRISVIASKDEPTIVARIVRFEKLIEAIQEELKQKLIDGIADVPTYIGYFDK